MKRGAVLGLFVLYVVWGSTYLAIRYGLESIPPFAMSGIRYACAGAILLAAAKVRGAPRIAAGDLVPAFTCGALLLLCGNGGVVWAEQRISSGLAALLVAIEPLFIVLLRALPPERHAPGSRALFGIALGLSGVAILLGPARLGGQRIDLLGAAAVLFAAFAWALGSLLSRRFAPAASPFQGTALQMLAGGALLLAASVATGEWARFSLAQVSARSWAAVLYLMVFGSLVGYTIYLWLLRVADPVARLDVRVREPGHSGLSRLGAGRRNSDAADARRGGRHHRRRRSDHAGERLFGGAACDRKPPQK